ncbi:hypothetical protein HYT02_05095 [Candidatus Gottesmanbacteria bacterium]|nr:hypothetical protein [Candidatus Gottesmanbacteria bacterium]
MDKKNQGSSSFEVSVNFDTTPILYTDNVLITANSDGVILDIGQRLGTTNKVRIVSRIGMSRIHAKKMVNELAKTLAISESQPRKKH